MKKVFYTYSSLFKIHLYQLTIFLMLAGFAKQVTAQNFRLVKDINTTTDGNPSNQNSNFAIMNGIGYFNADDGINGRGLWRTNGTTEGTYQVKAAINPSSIILSNGKLIFSGTGPLGLWTSDGTAAGTVPVLDVVPPGLGIFVPFGLADYNGKAFFALTNPSTQLWKTDGTANGTELVKDFNVGGNVYFNPTNFTTVKNKLYFSATTSADYQTSHLWVTDGSTAGTYIVSNTIAQPAQLLAGSDDVANPFVYFSASATQNGSRSLYITTGVADVAGVAAGFTGIVDNNYQQALINIGGTIYFIGKNNSGSPNTSLYKYTVANGTQPVKIVTGVNSNYGYGSSIRDLVQLNGVLNFTLFDAVNNKTQLWKSDGTSLGNVMIKDNFAANYLRNINGQLYFNVSDSGSGWELGKSDGTANGTVIVKDIYPGANGSNPGPLTYVNNKILFAAVDGVHGNELWQSDGTAAGTLLLKDINLSATASSDPRKLKTFNSQVVFLAKDGNTNNRAKFWKIRWNQYWHYHN